MCWQPAGRLPRRRDKLIGRVLGVTLFGLIFTPIFYMIVRNLADSSHRKAPAPAG